MISMEILKPESSKVRWLQIENYMRSRQIVKALEVLKGLATEGYSDACTEIGNILEQLNQDHKGQLLEDKFLGEAHSD